MQVMDIHSHTRYSNCGIDEPEAIAQAAFDGGITLFGVCDHNYGIGERQEQYKQELAALRQQYAGRMRILTGIEIASVPGLGVAEPEKLIGYDYCLLEHIDHADSSVGMNVFEYRRRFSGRFGIAHTDLIAMAKTQGIEPAAFLRRFAENDIFWEMNVSFDSIHAWREHPYVLRFLADEAEQAIVRESGIRLAVGFDGHRVYDYNPERVHRMNEFLQQNGFPMAEF
ncbi:MAG: PHP domain-containing protein [Oscillospiraceae bacterium]|nr:PHP domain-containing protein [Oscillospiraceae bacterium]